MQALFQSMRQVVVMAMAVALIAGIGAVSSGTVVAQTSWDCAAFPHTPPPVSDATPEAEPAPVEALPFPENAGDVIVFAAASLTDVYTAIEADLEAANPGLDLVFNFAGSQALVTQLSEGAPADVFASANNSQMNAAIEAGVISGDPAEFAQNKLAIVVPSDNPAGIESIADLDNDGVQVVLAAEDVPVGGYARTSICAAEAAGVDGEDFSAGVAGNVVSNESNVRNVLAKVALGEADAGIVYLTDITADVAADVTVIEIPNELNVIASYPIAAVEGGNAEAAAAFITYILSPDGQATLVEYGFS
ncbi:MAG: molybdate ABC transporter substrate-binding protein [Thermomicrobiales bacterium]|nr:molybdate ABC transporter substrate-binding protein [Thermomicrobiales bacterium]